MFLKFLKKLLPESRMILELVQSYRKDFCMRSTMFLDTRKTTEGDYYVYSKREFYILRDLYS